MIFIDNIASIFETIASKCDEVADRIEDIPLLGDYLALPFYSFETQFQFVSDNLENFSDWTDTIGDIIGGEVGKFLNMLNILRNEFIDVFNGLPTFEELIGFLEERFEILTKTPEQLVDWIKDFLPPIPTIENIVDWVAGAFESILDKLFEEGK